LEGNEMKNVVVIEGQEYEWLYDFLFRIGYANETPNENDYDRISGLTERNSCCQRCEDTWNAKALENAGYEKKGGVYVQA
jgi:hypothetical protein